MCALSSPTNKPVIRAPNPRTSFEAPGVQRLWVRVLFHRATRLRSDPLEVEDLVEELEHIKKKAVALIASMFSRQSVASSVHTHLCRETCVQLCAYTYLPVWSVLPRTYTPTA